MDEALRSAFDEEWGRVVATLIRVTSDWALAEDCAQDAFARAAATWPRDGVPRRPGAWLTTTARNAALDRLRRTATETRKLQEVALMQELEQLGDDKGRPADATVDDTTGPIPDDRLRLIFTCCHPALPLESQVTLTLRTLCGLTIAEIARAFGASDHAVSKRLVRARQKIAHAGIPYRVPTGASLPERLSGVLAVLYLLFTEGYAPSAGSDVVREPLSAEAIRLARWLVRLMPDDPEVHGLLALELLQDARRTGRVGADGELITLEEQDRRAWDSDQIAEAVEVLRSAMRLAGAPGPYVLQARIAAQHSTAATAETTDWPVIARLYGELAALTPSPYVELARAVAVAMADGMPSGLRILDALEGSGQLDGNHYLPATEADLLRRSGRHADARRAYRRALELVTNEAERRYLEKRLAEASTAHA